MQIFSNWALAAWMSVVFLWELITQPYSLAQIFCSFHTVSHIYSWITQGDYKHLSRLHVSIPVSKKVFILKKESHWKLIAVLDVSQWEILLCRDSIFAHACLHCTHGPHLSAVIYETLFSSTFPPQPQEEISAAKLSFLWQCSIIPLTAINFSCSRDALSFSKCKIY